MNKRRIKMKNVKLFVAILLVLVLMLAFVACETNDVVKGNGKIEIALASDVSPILKVGDTDVDFTKYFTVKDADGNVVTVTSDMLDLSKVDTSKAGSFEVTVTYGGESFTATIAVIPNTDVPGGEVEIALVKDLSLSLNVGDTDVDYTKYFTVKDADGNAVTVTNEMLDLSKVDTTKEGTFNVTLSYGGKELTATFTVNGKIVPPELDVQDILDKYADVSNWNFIICSNVTVDGDLYYVDYFGYKGEEIMYKIEATDEETGTTYVYTDYIKPLDDDDVWYLYYSDNGDGTYEIVEITEDIYDYMYFPEIWLDYLADYDFTAEGDHYIAVDPQGCGDDVYGSATGVVYTKVELYVDNGEISKVVFYSDETYNKETSKVVSTFELSGYGTLDFDLSTLKIAEEDPDDPIDNPAELEDILNAYANINSWNFNVALNVSVKDLGSYSEEFSCLGNLLMYAHDGLVDYVVCNSDGTYLHYGDFGGALYTKTVIDEYYYGEIYFPEVSLDYIVKCAFTKVDDHYEAVNSQTCGDNVYGAMDGCTYTKVELYVNGDKISKIIFFSDEYDEEDNVTYEVESVFELSGYGTVNFDISNLEIAYGEGVENDEELAEILAKYVDAENWNFSFDVVLKYDGELANSLGYGYVGDNAICVYYSEGQQLTDYLIYDTDSYYYLADNGDGTHTKITEDNYLLYYYASYMYVLNVDYLSNCAFELAGDHYEAKYPQVTGDMVYGEMDGCVYTSVELYVENGLISKLVFLSDEVYYDEDTGEAYPYSAEATFEFDNFGTLVIDISGVVIVEEEGGDDPVIPDEPVENPEELENAINNFADRDNWSFAVKYEQIESGVVSYEEFYEYYKNLMLNRYEYDGETYNDYWVFDTAYGDYNTYWADLGGEYEEIPFDDDYFEYYFYQMFPVDPTLLAYFEFELVDGDYVAKDPVSAASYIIGSFTGYEWTAFVVKLSDGKIATIEGIFDNGLTLRFTFSKYGEIELQLPEEGGDDPVIPDNPNSDTLTSTFVKADLSVGNGQIEYTSSVGANGLDPDRGLQFTQKNGPAVLTSKTSISGVTAVTVVVQTNSDKGFTLSIKVGGVALKCDGQTTVTVNKTATTDLQTITFVSESALNGNVEVTLTPNDTAKSMYISSIIISKTSEGGDEPVIPDDPVENPEELENAINDFADRDNWSFVVDIEQIINGKTYTDYYEYYKNLMLNRYEDYYGDICNDYWVYDPVVGDFVTLWADYGDEYVELTEEDDDFIDAYMYILPIDISLLSNFEFELVNNKYSAKDPVNAGGYAIGEFEDCTWTSLTITLANGKIATVEATLDDGSVITFTFSGYGEVELQLPEEGGQDPINPDDPVIPDDPTDETLTSTFISANLGVGKGEIEYTSTVSANSLDETRGLQFTQGNGVVVLTSKTSLSGVRSVAVVVQTNAELGMQVSIKVGGVALTSAGETIVTVASTSYTELVTLTFVSEDALNGNVEVTLTPTQTKKSMYILSITVSKSAEGGNDNPNPPTPPTPSGNVMENQTYNPDTFDNERLQDKLLACEDDGAIGLPSEGEYNVLVVPVQFKGDTITAKQLANLELAFNGTGADTGWESVKTYYQKSSYGKLNLNFDIQSVYQANNNSSYYERYQKSVSYLDGDYEYGDAVILREVLAYYESRLDLTKYDTNKDGCIDAVYLIYSAPIDYGDNSFYWAYVTWYYGEDKYDGLDAYYYLFASIDFMDEDLKETGLTINTTTYIHETGHLLGLDDYYDYNEKKGSNMGLGGADMMDYTVGDHNAYSKIMLNWVDGQIVTTTTTITIGNLVSTGDCILVPLAFDNSYFSEYLLIDLYSATGLNELAANAKESLLYDGAKYGVRIYHVSSSDNNPYSDEEYGSYTDNNNSTSKYALIKLVEADGEYNYNKSNGYTTAEDLWQAGDSLSAAFKTYTRNDGKVVNFDITINSVSATEASITITFAE